jgi:hypothetical protein
MTVTTTTRTTTRAPRLVAAVAGILLLLLTVQPALAISWGSDVKLSGRDNYRPQILRTGPSSAIMIWQRGAYLYARRTLDGGGTWTARSTVASGVTLYASYASNGSKVDVAYVKRIVRADGSVAYPLFYRRSVNGGATWQSARAITSPSSIIGDQDVARHANGQVSIAWTGLLTGNIYMRTSTDGGTTFGPARFVAKSFNSEPGRITIFRGDPRIAIGTGVTYVAYTSARDTLALRRSTNRGLTWSGAVRFSGVASPQYTIVAAGSKAIVGYTTSSSSIRAVFRRTVDKGLTWSSPRSMVALTDGQFSMDPQFALQSGVLAVVYKHGKPGASPIWHRQSLDFGATWSTPTRVSVKHFADSDPEPGGVAILADRLLAGYSENRREPNEGVWVRATQ